MDMNTSTLNGCENCTNQQQRDCASSHFWQTTSASIYYTGVFKSPFFDSCTPVVKVSDHSRHVTSSSPVPLKTHRVGVRCKLNLSRAQTSSRGCGVVVRRGGASSGVVTCRWFKITRSVAKSLRGAEQCDVNIHSLTRLLRSDQRKSTF
ncbi:uncharacterized protein TNCV_2018931 [Trichonephila clavipes]|nr:uncharacterized protein TNCV_2018931 [Trichonephila clavipes]